MKNIKTISTLLVGIVIGLGISFSPQIQAAADKLVGQKVTKTMDVKLNDKSIGQAAVIEGTSYLPVRALSENLGVTVGVNNTEIKLRQEGSGSVSEVKAQDSVVSQEDEDYAKSKKIETLKNTIDNTEKRSKELQVRVDHFEKNLTEEQKESDPFFKSYKQEIENNSKLIKEAQQELEKLQK
ncbi:hypothetical protein ACIFQM_17620 [Paenibacillus sp. NRS-1782]|uniref:hypothetical protein n=1 Tax=unclassified Paenibacillus TaxID=185978 RepID=UPI003159088C